MNPISKLQLALTRKPMATAQLIAGGGGNIISTGSGMLIAGGGGNLIAGGGGNVVSNNGGGRQTMPRDVYVR